MKALVGVKRVLDYAIKVRVNAKKSGVELKGLKMSMNPFDEIAVEQAIQLKEAGQIDEIIALSIGDKKAVDTIRVALAMGADRGIHVQTKMTTDQELQPLAVAKIFQKIMEDNEFDICLLGKQSIDGDYNQTGQILGSLMDVPTATFASELEIGDSDAVVTREVDSGLQKIKVSLPAIFTCDLRLVQPRFANVKSIIMAKKKKIETIKLEDLGIDVEPRLTIESVETPLEREGGVILESVDELVDKLRNEAKVI